MKRGLYLVIILILFFVEVSAYSTLSYNFNVQENMTYNLGEVLHDSSILFQINTDRDTLCKYSSNSGISYESMEGNFDYNLGVRFKKTFFNLDDGVYQYFVKCKKNQEDYSGELKIMFGVSRPVSAEIDVGNNNILKEGNYLVTLKTSKVVSSMPSLSYSFNGVSYNPIPLSGNGQVWTGYLIVPNNIGESVGSFRFSAKDLGGFLGEEINFGRIFLVDTLRPNPMLDVNAVGTDGAIKIS
jgi:hypothetical protein